jgi:hypothetical protein
MQGGSLEENHFGGLVAVGSSGIDIQDTSISATALAPVGSTPSSVSTPSAR